MNRELVTTINRANWIKRLSYGAGLCLRLVRSLLLAAILVSLWSYLKPTAENEQLILGTLLFIGMVYLSLTKRPNKIKAQDFLLALEMKYPQKKHAAFRLAKTYPDDHVAHEWQDALDQELNGLKRLEMHTLLSLLSTVVLPLVILFSMSLRYPSAFDGALSNVKSVVARLNWGANLKIIEGAAKEDTPDIISLTPGNISRIELLSQNMIEVELNGVADQSQTHIIELRKSQTGKDPEEESKIFQSFQMIPQTGPNGASDFSGTYKVSFTVSDHVDLYLNSLSETDPLAEIIVKQLPVPDVKMNLAHEIEEPWPDDKPLPLNIEVIAENPLRLVRILIRSGKRTSQQLVSNVLATDLTELKTSYELLLEPYVESDLATVELIAEAIDRSVPNPLIGRSKPLRLSTASTYGRYRQTLETLRQVKTQIDEALSQTKFQLPKEIEKLTKRAIRQADDSPFFDGLDRVQINNFHADIMSQINNSDSTRLIEVSETINEFLFEHEMLDDRERDRDFFVAIRGLSRLLEQDPEARPVGVKVVTGRIINFLDDRYKRWQLRIEHLPKEFKPPSWKQINQQRPFHKTMQDIGELEENKTKELKSQALIHLSKTATAYRAWIEELEQHEDRAREKMEQKRQQGLASARNELRELQRRQGQISQYLDRADMQAVDQLEDNWPAMRMEQNTNLKGTKRLEARLRSLSPPAAERIKLAAESMSLTLESASSRNFIQAESASDLAGRLLRQAQSAAQRSQQNRSKRGRRRRVTGDNYYGQTVVGGDVEIQRDYQVDKRYREDILNEIRESLSNQEDGSKTGNRKVLEDYLREVIR